VQDAVNRLAKAGQALDSDDFSTASSVLGSGTEATWVSNVDNALTKVKHKFSLCGYARPAYPCPSVEKLYTASVQLVDERI
jgi:hypothetical protein